MHICHRAFRSFLFFCSYVLFVDKDLPLDLSGILGSITYRYTYVDSVKEELLHEHSLCGDRGYLTPFPFATANVCHTVCHTAVSKRFDSKNGARSG